MSTTFYSAVVDIGGNQTCQVRAMCTYDVTTTDSSVTYSGTIALQHLGGKLSYSGSRIANVGLSSTKPTAVTSSYTTPTTSYSRSNTLYKATSAYDMSTVSTHTSWTTIRSTSFSLTVQKAASAATMYLLVGTNQTSVESYTMYGLYKTVTIPALASYSIKYNANGGTGAPATQTKYYGQTLTLSSTKPSRTNYVFKNWNTASGGTGTSYSPGGSYTANAAATLYAQWYAPYTVTYNANGGTGAPASQTKVYNTALKLTTVKPSRSNAAFVKWNTKADGSGTDYAPGASYTANAALTLYAIWVPKPQVGTLTAIRCDSAGAQDDEGTYAAISCTWSLDATVNPGVTSATVTGTIKAQSTGAATALTLSGATSGTGGTATARPGNLDTDEQYTVTITVTAGTQATSKSVILTRAFFTLDFKAGGKSVGIGRAAPQDGGLEVGFPTVFDQDVDVYGILESRRAAPEIRFTTPDTGDYPEGTTEYYSYIRAYDTNSHGVGHNLVMNSGGNTIIGSGESANALYAILAAGGLDTLSAASEALFLTSDSVVNIYSGANTPANRQRMAFGSGGVLEVPNNVRIMDSTTWPDHYPNAREATTLGYFYGNHVRLRSKEAALDNEATSRTANTDAVPVEVTDVDNRTFSRVLARQMTNGAVRTAIEAMGHHSGSNVWNNIGVEVRADGSLHYFCGSPANFRADMGITYANLGTVPVANGGTGATTAAAARDKLGAAAASWTTVKTTTNMTAVTFGDLNTAGYSEVMVVMRHSTNYTASIILPIQQIDTTERELYLSGGASSASSNRRAACKLTRTKLTPVVVNIDGSSITSSITWYLYAR